jgi:hypothetical protein
MKNSVTICHLSPASYLADFFVMNGMVKRIPRPNCAARFARLPLHSELTWLIRVLPDKSQPQWLETLWVIRHPVSPSFILLRANANKYTRTSAVRFNRLSCLQFRPGLSVQSHLSVHEFLISGTISHSSNIVSRRWETSLYRII